MTVIDVLRRLLIFVALCLAQALVLNRIQLFGCATPLLYVYFIIILPRGYPRWAALLWGFSLGLSVDMFANTPGVAAASMTLVALLQPYLIELFLPRDAEENIASAVYSLGVWRFLCLASILTCVFALAFFALELFSIFNWLLWLECAGASTLLTIVLIMAMESTRR